MEKCRERVRSRRRKILWWSWTPTCGKPAKGYGLLRAQMLGDDRQVPLCGRHLLAYRQRIKKTPVHRGRPPVTGVTS